MFQGQIGKITPQDLGKSDNVPVLALFSTCPFLQFGLPTLIEIIFLELERIGLSFHRVWSF